jgi:menaquinol-cytochrome c reductase iron-sulfur subunit
MSDKQDITRRQFLNYSLLGVGGFLAATMLTPMVRFALDPVLQPEQKQDMVAVCQLKDVTTEPKSFSYKVHQVDGWYESDVVMAAWVYKDGKDNIIALSPICKHLGCTVNWNSDITHPEHFYCPCHGGLYTKDGTNVPNTPPMAPLDRYDKKVKNGTLYLGKAKPRKGA